MKNTWAVSGWIVVCILLYFISNNMIVRAQTPNVPISIRVYNVLDPAAFPVLPSTGRSMIFRNGLFMSPNVDYTLTGVAMKFKAGVLNSGDQISVAMLP